MAIQLIYSHLEYTQYRRSISYDLNDCSSFIAARPIPYPGRLHLKEKVLKSILHRRLGTQETSIIEQVFQLRVASLMLNLVRWLYHPNVDSGI